MLEANSKHWETDGQGGGGMGGKKQETILPAKEGSKHKDWIQEWNQTQPM